MLQRAQNKIAEDLLLYGDDVNQFLGATILYSKIDRGYHDTLKEDQIKQFIQFHFDFLDSDRGKRAQYVVKEKICMGIAKLGIYTSDTVWNNFVEQIIEYGGDDIEKTLLILSNVPRELDSLVGNIPLRNKMKFELISKSTVVFNLISQVLSTEGLSHKVYELAFKSIEEWIIKTEKFISHEKIQEIVFSAFKSEWFLQVVQILSQVITKSPYAKLFQNVSYESAFKTILPEDLRFLQSVSQLLIDSTDQFKEEMENPYSDFCKEISELAYDLLSNFEIILFENNEITKNLFDFIQMMCSNSSYANSIRALQFFGEFKETLQIVKQHIEEPNFLLSPFYTAWRNVIKKSQRKRLISLDENGNAIEDDGHDSDDETENLFTYREYSNDLFFNTYYLAGEMGGKEYKAAFENIIMDEFKTSQEDLITFAKAVESAITAAKASLDAWEVPEDQLVIKVWSAILELKDFKEPTVMLSALQFINEASQFLENYPEILKDTLVYIINWFVEFHKIPLVQRNVFKSLVEIGQNASSQFNEETFEMYLSFIEENAALIDKDNCSFAMEGICSLWSVVDNDKIPEVMHRIVKCAIDIFPSLEFSDPNHRIVFVKSLLMLCGAVKILSRFSEKAIKETLKPILESFLSKIGEAFEYYSLDTEVWLTICNFYSRSIKALGPDFDQYFNQVATDWFNAFSKNKRNTKWLDVWSLAISLMGYNSVDAQSFINENFEPLAGLILENIGKLFLYIL